MALVKLSDYYSNEESGVCDALGALSDATDIQITDDPDKYFDGSPCAFGMVIKETPENTDFDDYIALEDGCLKPLPDPGALLYDETTVKPTFLSKEESRRVGYADYGSPIEREPIEMGEVTIPAFSQDMSVIVYVTVFFHNDGGYRIKFLPKYGEQLLEADYTELPDESNTLYWVSSASYQNHISHVAGTEAKFRILIKHSSGTVKVIVCALVFRA